VWQNERNRQFVILSAANLVGDKTAVSNILKEFDIPENSNISLEVDDRYNHARY
jgi:hypothetical protein